MDDPDDDMMFYKEEPLGWRLLAIFVGALIVFAGSSLLYQLLDL
ncbi:hypothetical protein ACSVBT_17370 [Afipia sp. TerB]